MEGNRGTHLKTAHQSIIDLLREESTAFVVHAGPAPDVFIVAIVPGTLKYTSCESPHDDVEDEEPNSEHGVVDGCLLGSVVSTTPVGPEDDQGESKRNTGNRETDILGPCLGACGPGWKVVTLRQGLGSVEDGEGCRKHGKDDKTAREIDATEDHLGHADAGFYFLQDR
jgi:hypothetical protein